jgi:Shugoshin C terminus
MASPQKKAVQQVGHGKPEHIPKRRGEEENARRTDPKKISPLRPDQVKKAKRATPATIHEDEPTPNSRDSVGKERQRKHSFNESNMNEPAVTETTPLPGLTSRPSRRARGAISYAEPNLRDKMRRATNELSDAVAIEQARHTTGNSGKDIDAESHDESSPENDTTSSLAAIQHNSQGIVAELPKHMVTERKRRTLSASTNELARLSKTEYEADLSQNTEPGSPTTTTTAQENPRRRSASLNPQSRRHSSNPAGYDRGKSHQPDRLETSEFGSESRDIDTIVEVSQPHKPGINKDISARVRGTRNLVEDSSNVQATRSQRASSRRRSTLL